MYLENRNLKNLVCRVGGREGERGEMRGGGGKEREGEGKGERENRERDIRKEGENEKEREREGIGGKRRKVYYGI